LVAQVQDRLPPTRIHTQSRSYFATKSRTEQKEHEASGACSRRELKNLVQELERHGKSDRTLGLASWNTEDHDQEIEEPRA
jgi:hypothetical protein